MTLVAFVAGAATASIAWAVILHRRRRNAAQRIEIARHREFVRAMGG